MNNELKFNMLFYVKKNKVHHQIMDTHKSDFARPTGNLRTPPEVF